MRFMRILTQDGVITVPVRDPDTASDVGLYWGSVGRFLATGDETVLDELRGTVIEGHELETDPDAIEDFDADGDLDFRDIYDT